MKHAMAEMQTEMGRIRALSPARMPLNRSNSCGDLVFSLSAIRNGGEGRGGGGLKFTRLEPVERKVKYVRKNGLSMAVTDAPVSWQETHKAMDELP